MRDFLVNFTKKDMNYGVDQFLMILMFLVIPSHEITPTLVDRWYGNNPN